MSKKIKLIIRSVKDSIPILVYLFFVMAVLNLIIEKFV